MEVICMLVVLETKYKYIKMAPDKKNIFIVDAKFTLKKIVFTSALVVEGDDGPVRDSGYETHTKTKTWSLLCSHISC